MEAQKLMIGFVSLVRLTFDTELAARKTGEMAAQLRDAGFTLVQVEEMVTSPEEAAAAARTLAEEPIDLLFVFQSTFADSTMILALALAIDVPLLIWAVPEAPNGDRLRSNALCGVNLGVHALRRAGHRYTTVYAHPDEPWAIEKVRVTARAGHVRRRLRAARIGLVGEHPPGFVTCDYDPATIRRRLGPEVVPFPLEAIFEQVRQVPAPAVEAQYDRWGQQVAGLDALDQTGVQGALASYVALRDLAETHRLDGLSVRCWFQFVEEIGCAVCGAQCMLSNELLPASCEADVNGTITQLVLQWLSDTPVFDSDIVSFDMDANTAVFWHCGKAPLSMADPDATPRAIDHFNFKKPLTFEFTLKPGRVTLARLSEATGDYRLVIGGGEVVQAPPSFRGTSGVVRFDSPARDVLDTILGEGLEHHLALVYGDHQDALLALAEMLDLPVLRL